MSESRARNAEKCQQSRDEAVQCLVEILKTPIGDFAADHRLAQSYDAKSGEIELAKKLGAMQLLAKRAAGTSQKSTRWSMASSRGGTH